MGVIAEHLTRYRPPTWMRNLTKTSKPQAFPWGLSIRLAIGLAIPLALGVWLDEAGKVLFFAMGVFFATTTQRAIAYRRSITQVMIAAPVGLGCYIIGAVGAQGTVAQVIVITIVGLIASLVSTTGAMASTLSMFGLMITIMAANAPSAGTGSHLADALLSGLMLVGGVALALLLLIIEALMRGSRPEEWSVGVLAAALAQFAQTTADAADDIDPHAGDAPPIAAVTTSATSEAILKAREACVRASDAAYRDLLFERSHGRGQSRENDRRAAILGEADAITRAIIAGAASETAFRGAATALSDIATRQKAHEPQPPKLLTPASDSPADKQLAERINTFIGLLWPGSHPADLDEIPLDGAAARWLDKRPVTKSLFSRLRGSLSFGASAWRDALRIALCLGVGVIVGQWLHPDHGYWIPMMVAMIMKPDFGSVFARALQRTGGTILGGLIAVALVALIPHTGPALPVLIVLVAVPIPWAALRAYWLVSIFSTPVVILLMTWASGSVSDQLIWFRVLDTGLAALIVLVLGYLIWPGSLRTDMGSSFSNALDRIGAYLSAVFAPDTGSDDATRHIAMQRETVYRGLSNLQVELQRTLAEPPPASRAAEAWYPAVASASRLADLVTAYGEARHRAAMNDDLDGFPVPAPETVKATVATLTDLGTLGAQSATPRWRNGRHGAAARQQTDATPEAPQDPTGALDPVDEEITRLADLVRPDTTPQRAGRRASTAKASVQA